MKEPHPTDNFRLSEAEFYKASRYWQCLFKEIGLLPHPGWNVVEVKRLLDGSVDMGAGVLLTLVNLSEKKVLRLSQSERLETAYLLAHTVTIEIDGIVCYQLNLHCSPSIRIEGLIALISLAWFSPNNSPANVEEAITRFLPHEIFEETYTEEK